MFDILNDLISAQEMFKDAALFTDKAAVAAAFDSRCMEPLKELEGEIEALVTRSRYIYLLNRYSESLCFLHMEQQPETHRAAFMAWIKDEAAKK